MNPARTPTDDELRRLLQRCRRIAVVGLSADPSRPSHRVASYLQRQGCDILPVNPRYAQAGTTVLGQVCHARLEDVPGPVDLVDVFRKTEDVLPVARSAIAIGALGLWQQQGVHNAEADALLRAAGLASVMDRCLMVDHARLLGEAARG